MNFDELPLQSKILETLQEKKFSELTAIQEKTIQLILQGKDIVGQAETGSGKTLAFCLPLLDKIAAGQGIQALILTPTRELCVQVTDVFKEFGKPLDIHTTSIFGGVGIDPQIRALKVSDIVVGTPGRILDHTRRKTLDYQYISYFVLDETDKMFEMGFIDDVEDIISHVPRHRQMLMYSATIPHDLHRLMKRHLKNPIVVKTQSYVDPKKLRQVYYDIFDQNQKFSLLVHLLKENDDGLSIVFCATRVESDIVSRNLRNQGIHALAIHGGMRQSKRLDSLDALKKENINVLVATDVAARGLDIKNVTHIYNYDVPQTAKEYVHRIGRTARAGEKGSAITLLTRRDHDNFRRVQENEDLNIQRAEFPEFQKVAFQRHAPQKRRRNPYTRRPHRRRSSR